MATIRYNILRALRDRLGTIAGWSASLRQEVNTGNHPVEAIVVFLGENVEIANTEQVLATMTIAVEITARIDDAADTYAGDSFAYLDDLVALAEKKINSPDSWGLDPGFTDLRIDGHDVADPPGVDEFTEVSALLRMTVVYRHHYQDPGAV
jgi:hypothetical protein